MDTFYLIVGIAGTLVMLGVMFYYGMRYIFHLDMRVYFFAALADYIAAWYNRKEEREAAANRRRTPVRHSAERKN
jgi:hypothetical protein